MKKKIVQSIFNSIDSLNAQLPSDKHIEKSNNTILLGSDNKIDSLGLINLIVAVEENIEEEFNVTITLADERAMSEEHSPFKSVASLSAYIEKLLEEKLND